MTLILRKTWEKDRWHIVASVDERFNQRARCGRPIEHSEHFLLLPTTGQPVYALCHNPLLQTIFFNTCKACIDKGAKLEAQGDKP